MPEIKDKQPRKPLNPDLWTYLKGLEEQADPNFHLPARIDILLYLETPIRAERPGFRTSNENEPIAKNTV